MSKSKANSVGDTCECSNLNNSDNGNCCPIPGSSALEVNLEVIPKKRSKSPEEVNFSNKGKEKYLKNSKRKKGEVYKHFLEESASNKKKNVSCVPKKELCQTSQSSSASYPSESEDNSKQEMELSVPNIDENINTASSSTNDTNIEPQNNNAANSAQESTEEMWTVRKKKVSLKKKRNKTNEITKAEDDSYNPEEKQKINTDNFEEELTCSICSEIFISAVTLNCSHSFCKYCIMQWRKNHATCPICRQNISSQNSTLVLDKCVERVLETSKEEIKNHRKELIEYREEHKDPDIQPGSAPIITNDEHGWVDLDDESSDDEYDFFDDEHDFHVDEYFDQSDYSEEDQYYDDDVEYEEEEDEVEDEDHYEVGNEEVVSDEDGDQEEESNYEEEEEYEEDGYEDTVGEEESEEDGEGNECNEEDSHEESDYYDGESICSDYENRCFNCGLTGHYARACPTRVPYTGIDGAYYGGYGICFRCNEEGHWANGCPNIF